MGRNVNVILNSLYYVLTSQWAELELCSKSDFDNEVLITLISNWAIS